MLQPARLGVEAFGGVDEVKPDGWEWGGDAAVDVATLGLRRGLVWFHVVVPQGVRVGKGSLLQMPSEDLGQKSTYLNML